ncbi:hypothetical protein [Coleofasciculus sp. FACHB-1120]|uniref:hypothetical protein n=1 Tax=Coleofasciculus sp. FACHB-1120 TaxID=2692783 RepID=UPI00168744D9|nr:hypothetical protein [Coleofasciculus sp. FACHB-1120]MBD2740998.1 hypothetical protein [Coleofasciculus sp. FACHB-1120]
MKLNSTVALTLILLAMMLGAGFVSAMWGFTVGHEALKGVTQPDVRPTNKLAGTKRATPGKEGLAILREADIVASARAQMSGKAKPVIKPVQEQTKSNTEPSTPEPTSEPESKQQNFPITSQDKGVKLEIGSARQQGGSLLLNVSMKNEGGNAVRFLYSFLNVTDDQGRALSAVTEGLPGELPPNGQSFSGTVSIPTALLEDAKQLSLTLTDYPDQKLQLKMSGIPVVK